MCRSHFLSDIVLNEIYVLKERKSRLRQDPNIINVCQKWIISSGRANGSLSVLARVFFHDQVLSSVNNCFSRYNFNISNG